MSSGIKGICPIISTPFTETGEVDYDSMRNLLHTLMAGGCHALTLFGIAGEYYKLNDEESKNLVEIVVEECRRGNVPSIISVTDHSTKLAVDKARYLQDAGADSLMLLPPFFLKPGAAALRDHIRQVAQAVSIPVIVQYAPEQTGVGIDPAVFQELSNEFPHLDYKIECKPPGAYISRLLAGVERPVNIYVGNAGYQMLENFDRGAVGVMPGCSMFDIYLKVYHHYMNGNRQEAVHIHNILISILNHIRQNVEMIIYYEKQILYKRGIIESGHCRIPSFTPDKIYDALFEEYYEQTKPYFDEIKVS